MSKTKLLNDVIVTAAAMNYICSEISKNIVPWEQEFNELEESDEESDGTWSDSMTDELNVEC